MNEEKLKLFTVPILLLFASVVVIVLFAPKIYTNIQNYMSVKSSIESNESQVREKQQLLETYKQKESEQKTKETKSINKPFYKPVFSGMDTEAVIAGEFAEILQLIQANKIKVRSIKYDYDPQDDLFVKGAGDKYNVARLNMEMVANYLSYDNFLRELYKHPHFLDIQSVEIVPYRKNKRILLVNFKLKLYAKK